MTARPDVSLDQLRLEVTCTRREDDGIGAELRLMDATGSSIMVLKLPESAIQAMTKIGDCRQFTMSPDGSLAIYSDHGAPILQNGMGLDELVRQSLAPDMLQDEPHLQSRLTELKRKLTASMTIVENTLSALLQVDS